MRDIGEDVSSYHTYTSTYVLYSGTEYVRTLYCYTTPTYFFKIYALNLSSLFCRLETIYTGVVIYKKFTTSLTKEEERAVGARLESEARCPSVLEYVTGVVMSGFY